MFAFKFSHLQLHALPVKVGRGGFCYIKAKADTTDFLCAHSTNRTAAILLVTSPWHLPAPAAAIGAAPSHLPVNMGGATAVLESAGVQRPTGLARRAHLAAGWCGLT